jgi:hypothetical protein
MKKVTLLILFFAISLPSFSQSLGYDDLALLFSKDNNTGTARFNAMSGAFGALGGDLSAIKINPAGASVFKNSFFSASVNSRTTETASSYYGSNNTTTEEFFNFSQAGAVFVYKGTPNSDWSKFAFSFNYAIKNDYNNYFLSSGNSGYATFTESPLDTGNPKIEHTNAEYQEFSNTYSGELAEYNFAISGVYKNDLHLGAAINTYDLKFLQRSTLREENNDGNGNILDTDLYQENYTTATGFSLSAGAIYKANKNLRLGFSYQTPIWFTEVLQDTNYDPDSDVNIGETFSFNGTEGITEFNDLSLISYKLKTPAKTTFSAAYIFKNKGLISADYTMNGYKKIKLSNGDFNIENQFFNNNLRNTYTLNIGTEWRFKALSVRGGYHYEQSPDAAAIESDNTKGYSFGAGYNFGNMKLDFAYQNKSNTQLYNFYPQYDEINAAELTIDNRIITATLTISL